MSIRRHDGQGKSHTPKDAPSSRGEWAPCRSSVASSSCFASRNSSANTSRARIGGPRPHGHGVAPARPELAHLGEPLYGVGEWAARHDTRWLDLSDEQLPALNDDRVGRALDRLFDADVAALVLDVAAHAVSAFDVTLDELHNDSTTVTFHGDYENAERERTMRGRLRLAVTWGHNKDHRPDLKQLLYILTVSGDGAVPVHFRVESGNATDDRSHRETWDLLCKLTGRADSSTSRIASWPPPRTWPTSTGMAAGS